MTNRQKSRYPPGPRNPYFHWTVVHVQSVSTRWCHYPWLQPEKRPRAMGQRGSLELLRRAAFFRRWFKVEAGKNHGTVGYDIYLYIHLNINYVLYIISRIFDAACIYSLKSLVLKEIQQTVKSLLPQAPPISIITQSPDIAKWQTFQTSVVVLVGVFFKIKGHMFWASFLKQSGTWPTDELLWLPKICMCQKVTNTETVVRTQNTQNAQVHVYLIHQQKL